MGDPVESVTEPTAGKPIKSSIMIVLHPKPLGVLIAATLGLGIFLRIHAFGFPASFMFDEHHFMECAQLPPPSSRLERPPAAGETDYRAIDRIIGRQLRGLAHAITHFRANRDNVWRAGVPPLFRSPERRFDSGGVPECQSVSDRPIRSAVMLNEF